MRCHQILTLACLFSSLVLVVACGEEDKPTGPIVEVPTVATGGLAGAGARQATVTGTLDAMGVESSYWFEYGLDVSYGSFSSEAVLAATPLGPHSVTGELTGLSPETTYHYRVVARNVAGTSAGLDANFITLPDNQPPNTFLAVAGPDTLANEVRLHVYWTGMDPDGVVVMYEHRLIAHGLDGILDEADSLGFPWNTTVVTDTVLTWANGLGAQTFFVRAVDNLGARDPSPAQFTATPTSGPGEPSTDYYPLTTGSWWTYDDGERREVLGPVVLDGRNTIAVSSVLRSDSTVWYYSYEPEGKLYLHARNFWHRVDDSPWSRVVFSISDPERLVFDATVDSLTRWSNYFTARKWQDGGFVPWGDWVNEEGVEMRGWHSMTTPAGDFVALEAETTDYEPGPSGWYYFRYYSPGIGEVYQLKTGHGDFYKRLTDYHIEPK